MAHEYFEGYRQIADCLRKSYECIQKADTSNIDAYYLAIQEAQGYIAEALDIADAHI